MTESAELVKDPVCEMVVRPGQHEAAHDGIRYAFCSLQCRERFVARPGLYVGIRRKPAPKQMGMKLVRQRRMLLSHSLTRDLEAALLSALREMMGIVDVKYFEVTIAPGNTSQQSGDEAPTTAGIGGIEITYDLLEATVAQLERKIVEVGGRFGNGLGEKLRRDFVHYIEECELEDVEAGDPRVTRSRNVRRTRTITN